MSVTPAPFPPKAESDIMGAMRNARGIGGLLAAACLILAVPVGAADESPQVAAGKTSDRQRVPEGNYEAGQWQLPAGLVDLKFNVTKGPGTDIELTFDAKQVVEEPGQPPKEKRACYSARTSTIQQIPGQWTVRLQLVPC
ncbi:MAG: hypothetical protein U1F33_10440 [Alphaproteobacteria bacterium]